MGVAWREEMGVFCRDNFNTHNYYQLSPRLGKS
jgi:hypothetical protein